MAREANRPAGTVRRSKKRVAGRSLDKQPKTKIISTNPTQSTIEMEGVRRKGARHAPEVGGGGMKPVLHPVKGSAHSKSGHPGKTILLELAKRNPGVSTTQDTKGAGTLCPNYMPPSLNLD